jgi:hypothetical protein
MHNWMNISHNLEYIYVLLGTPIYTRQKKHTQVYTHLNKSLVYLGW